MSFDDIAVSHTENHVRLIQLTRKDARNALRNQTLAEICSVLNADQNDPNIRAVVINGNDKYFAAGADLKEMQSLDSIKSLNNVRADYWKILRQFNKPLIAAVNGYALGAGCELLMHCDIAIAGHNAKIGQPEINLGIIPGAGGTQRLIRTVGKSMAMKMVLSGEFIDAPQALAAGLVAEICEPEDTQDRAITLATTIATKSPLAIKLAKQAMLAAFETTLESGLEQERQMFALLMGTADRDEGIAAFLEKREAKFTGN